MVILIALVLAVLFFLTMVFAVMYFVSIGQGPSLDGTPDPTRVPVAVAVPAAELPPDPAWRWVPGFHRRVGLMLVIGGLWHVAAPYLFGYSDIHAATTSNLISGLALAAVGVVFAIADGGLILCALGGLIGLWVLIAPAVLGFAWQGSAMNEAVWGGPLTMILVGISALERRLEGRAYPTGGMRMVPAGPTGV